jgi:hypothetical protein
LFRRRADVSHFPVLLHLVRHFYAEQNRNIEVANKSFETVEKFVKCGKDNNKSKSHPHRNYKESKFGESLIPFGTKYFFFPLTTPKLLDIILPPVSYECENGSFTLREEHKKTAFKISSRGKYLE